jgi:hypothetical protein
LHADVELRLPAAMSVSKSRRIIRMRWATDTDPVSMLGGD